MKDGDVMEIKLVEGQFQKIVVNEGDVIVVTVPEKLNLEDITAIGKSLKEVFLKGKAIILDGGKKLDVVTE